MTKVALYVPLQAKPGKEKEVADFLRSAVPLVNAEPGTIAWFAIQEGPSSFAIFDTFNDEGGREAHLNGKVAAALMEKAKTGDLFAKTPEIHNLDQDPTQRGDSDVDQVANRKFRGFEIDADHCADLKIYK